MIYLNRHGDPSHVHQLPDMAPQDAASLTEGTVSTQLQAAVCRDPKCGGQSSPAAARKGLLADHEPLVVRKELHTGCTRSYNLQ